MKRATRCLLVLAVTLALGAALSGDGWAQGILSTKHNLSPTGPGPIKALTQTDTLNVANTEVCVYCHTPHGADTTVNAPLWNRAINTTASAYTMYSNTLSSTYDATTDTQPTGVSLACLSCHDGTIAFDALRNLPGPGGFADGSVASPIATDGTRTTWTFAGAAAGKKMPAGVTSIGTDLSNDHPVSMLYSSALSPSSTDPANTNANGFKTEASVTGPVGTRTGGLVLYAGKVQCGSCHDPHRSNTNTFLRKSNDGSELCLTCHKKDG